MDEKNLIIGTAGHIDHGKTTLIKALTGIDTDRLEAEKKRGISIELGFGCLELEDDLQVGIIDVPGHEKFIKNMLAGAGGVDLALLVIAADEGFMPQSEEHLAILNLLNVEAGMIAVTKSDLVEEEWLELVIEEIKEEVAGTFLEGAPIVPVSATEGMGLEQLKKEISNLVDNLSAKDINENAYLSIDRVFSLQGHGTVTTGTLSKGRIEVDDKLMIYPQEKEVRVRSLQVHNQQVTEALAGQRVGINLAGVETDEIERGDALATTDSLMPTEFLDARLRLLSSAPTVIEPGDDIRLYLGAKEVLGKIYPLDTKEIYPGEEAFVQFRLEEEVVAVFRERYVLRRRSPMDLLGGGEILDLNPSYHHRLEQEVIEGLKIRAQGSLEEIIELSLRGTKDEPLTIRDLVKETALSVEQLREILAELKEEERVIELKAGQESIWLDSQTYQQLQNEILDYLDHYHQDYHLQPGMTKEELRTKLSLQLDAKQYDLLLTDLEAEGLISIAGAQLKLAEFEIEFSSQEQEVKERIIDLFIAEKFTPPKAREVLSQFKEEKLAARVFNSLVATGELIELSSELYFHKSALEEAEQKLREYLSQEESIELGEFRDVLNSTRKYTLPLLRYFDQQGITLRQGEARVLTDN
ncbi:selenocysteine-specific translation elongation factor [Natroniella sulfidigena]|uniref:selenocysteine-specific translation elongation factor n=1 Tax=Natroniella sulfidigena TaxID=723921 RepID=UPI00200A6D0E|nr:selenocysteine-specific translation elongation factor [Natroniella sulfidigena]MCK8816733.1 selenocysteine-specific translation elongation factor [Natroniella sulfidigena]